MYTPHLKRLHVARVHVASLKVAQVHKTVHCMCVITVKTQNNNILLIYSHGIDYINNYNNVSFHSFYKPPIRYTGYIILEHSIETEDNYNNKNFQFFNSKMRY